MGPHHRVMFDGCDHGSLSLKLNDDWRDGDVPGIRPE